jgi:hypothetical protein
MSSSWWANKLGTQQPAQPARTMQPTQPAQVQQPNPVPPQQYNTPPVNYTPAERCPGCGSGNYGGATPEARKRCYDCGYPIQQSGSGSFGVQGPRSQGPTQPAKQVASGGFNPTTIIGKL